MARWTRVVYLPKTDADNNSTNEEFSDNSHDFFRDFEEDECQDNDDMYYEFTASRISGDGNAVFPDKLIITNDGVIYRKGRVIGYKEIKIRHSAIGSVSLDKHLLFADIIIETNGGQTIVARGFSRSDASMIRDLLD